jgi:hypothetical protein
VHTSARFPARGNPDPACITKPLQTSHFYPLGIISYAFVRFALNKRVASRRCGSWAGERTDVRSPHNASTAHAQQTPCAWTFGFVRSGTVGDNSLDFYRRSRSAPSTRYAKYPNTSTRSVGKITATTTIAVSIPSLSITLSFTLGESRAGTFQAILFYFGNFIKRNYA